MWIDPGSYRLSRHRALHWTTTPLALCTSKINLEIQPLFGPFFQALF